MKKGIAIRIKICVLLFSVITSQVAIGQCELNLVTSTSNPSCPGCNNGSASVSVSGGTAPYTYLWTNNVSPGIVNIFSSKDNSIYEETQTNSNGAGQYLLAGMTNAGWRNRALLSFDIAGNIPLGASISTASLQLNMTFTSGASGPQPHSLYRVLQAWGEGSSVNNSQPGQGAPATANDATWLKSFYPATDWTNAGGYFNASASAVSTVNNPGIYTWSSAQMVNDIQNWLINPAANYGWLLKSEETGNRQAKRYASRENVVPGYPPVLTVNYGPVVYGNTSAVSNLAPGNYNVTVTDAVGCTATTSVTIYSASPQATTYRGAFAPAPAAQWTNNWTNWDPNNTFYADPNITIGFPATDSLITTNTTWTKNNVYRLKGLVYVVPGVTLTIEPGTVIRGDQTVANSSLIVQRGATIIANGTECNPIVFTSGVAQGSRAKGDWGGVIILGAGPNNNPGGVQLIEGIAQPNARVEHGGGASPTPTDNSGSLKYVRIEFPGFVFAPNNEINGLTLGSVGSGTTLDYIQVSNSNDDSFEWFGGTVNAAHLVAYKGLDDDFDTDNGYNGLIQFALGVKDPTVSDVVAVSTSEGWESDNNAGGTTATPKTAARFYNVTQIGAFRCANNAGGITQPSAPAFRRGARLRRNTEQKIFNSILMNNWRGLLIDAVTLATNQEVFQNNIIAMDTTTVWTGDYAGAAKIYEDAGTENYAGALALTNTRLGNPCDVLTNAWDFLNPDYRPSTTGGGGALAGSDLSPSFQITNPLFTANQSNDFLVNVIENNKGTSNGVITLRINVPSGWTVTVPGLTLTTTPTAGTDGSNTVGAYTNSNWLFSQSGSLITITSQPGFSIAKNTNTKVGFVATRKATTASGTNQNVQAIVSGGSDNNAANNNRTQTFGAN